ncbi:hypothetical protein [Phenylobacterium aquaticum]|uniref:hypothetical protein n=1 Tax=Phenylobacterium aquaticum TaxID=1763816 RepID=UPI001F5DA92D|nr:hypothetical protein [Phenylobacterium aquaticum]MCI3131096.1 hypothetical protein [Phenylobacterium aquaticum]
MRQTHAFSLAALMSAAPALAIAEPAGAEPINNALAWIQGALLGNVATRARLRWPWWAS